MVSKIFGNFVNGKLKLIHKNKEEEYARQKIYSCLDQFYRDYPRPVNPSDKRYSQLFYWALLNGVRDADLLSEEDRKTRSNLLVKIGIESGIINTNKGARL
jgi:hypothetical protein